MFQRATALLIAASLFPAAAECDRSLSPPLDALLDRVWKSDAYWTDDFAVPGVDGSVSVVEELAGRLYVGGWFTQADGVKSQGLVRFDGRRWEAFPNAFFYNEAPTAMLPDGSSMLVAGDFRGLSSGERYAVVRWTANEVVPVGGSAMVGRVVRMFRWNGKLIAAGYLRFDQDPNLIYLLAQLGSAGWAPLGPSVSDANLFLALDAAPFLGRIVIGGQFRTTGQGEPTGLLELRADGSAFDTLATASAVRSHRIDRLEVHDGRLVGAGLFVFESGPLGRFSRNLVAWDGATWTPLDNGFQGNVTALRSTPNGLLIGGRLFPVDAPGVPVTVARLVGDVFEPLPGLDGTWVLSLALRGNQVVAGSRRYPAVGISPGPPPSFLTLAAHDGERWESIGIGNDRVGGLDSYYAAPGYAAANVFLEVENNWFAGGRFDVSWHPFGQWIQAGPIVRWSAPGWVPFGTGIEQGTAHALAWYRDHLYAAGNFHVRTDLGYVDARLIRSDGGAWGVVDGSPALGDILSLAVFEDRLIVGGTFADAGSQQVRGIAALDGDTWTTVGGAILESPSYARISELLVHENSLYVAGLFDKIAGVGARGVARWDGQSWHALGDGFRGQVHALAAHGRRIAVAGDCFDPPCQPVTLWDGSAWTELPEAPTNVLSMASRAGILFIGGNFLGSTTYLGPDARLRAWDGRAWHALGTAFQDNLGPQAPFPVQVFALGIRNDVLWVGGSFTRVGGQTALNVATWTGLTRQGRPQRSLRDEVSVTPNPSRPGAAIALEIDGGAAEVGIYDLAGRRLHTVTAASDGERASATWNGRAADGTAVPAGIYFARATREGRVIATRRLIRLP